MIYKIVFGGCIVFILATMYSIMKKVDEYDRAEEERMRREIYGYDVPEPEEEEKEDEQM